MKAVKVIVVSLTILLLIIVSSYFVVLNHYGWNSSWKDFFEWTVVCLRIVAELLVMVMVIVGVVWFLEGFLERYLQGIYYAKVWTLVILLMERGQYQAVYCLMNIKR